MYKVTLSHVYKAFDGRAVLNDVSLIATAGKILALIGPSGAGKSTLLKLIADIEPMDDGKIAVEARPAVLVWQDLALFERLTVAENVAFGPKALGHSNTSVSETVERELERCSLSGFSQRRVQSLSGGQRQRVALARALAVDPKVLLLDEPFSAVDSAVRESLRALVKEVSYDRCVILSSHSRDDVLALAAEVAIVEGTAVSAPESIHTVFDRPKCVYSALFSGEFYVFSADNLNLCPRNDRAVAVRKSKVKLSPPAEMTRVSGEAISSSQASYNETEIILRLKTGAKLAVRVREALPCSAGDTLHLTWSDDDYCFLPQNESV